MILVQLEAGRRMSNAITYAYSRKELNGALGKAVSWKAECDFSFPLSAISPFQPCLSRRSSGRLAHGEKLMNEGFENQPVAASTRGLSDNVASALAYIFIVGIIFLFIEPYRSRPLVRFHCFQSIYLALLSFAANLLGHIPGLSTVMDIVSVLLLVVWIVALVMALTGRKLRLPGIGPLAERNAATPASV